MKQLCPILRQVIVGADPCLTATHAHVALALMPTKLHPEAGYLVWSLIACLLCMNVNVACYQYPSLSLDPCPQGP